MTKLIGIVLPAGPQLSVAALATVGCGERLARLAICMSDVFTTAKRSAVMSLIRGSGNKDTELRLIEIFRAQRITGWRRHPPLFGKPDFVFPKLKIVVLVDGCFWHGCSKHGVKPKNNADFWLKKISGNQVRDRLVTKTLRQKGWRVLRIWEHELTKKNERRLVSRLNRHLCRSN